MAAALAAAGASEVVTDEAELARAVSTLLYRPRLRAERCAAGAQAAAAGFGVLDAVDQRLAPWLDRLAPFEGVDAAGAVCSPLRMPA
jgi:hypothetical protein